MVGSNIYGGKGSAATSNFMDCSQPVTDKAIKLKTILTYAL